MKLLYQSINKSWNCYKYINKIQLTGNKAYIHTSPKRQAIPPLIWLVLKPFSKLTALLAGRGVRKWWATLPQNKRTIFIDHFKRNRIRYAGFVIATCGGSAITYYGNLEYTPITNRQRFMLFSRDHLTDIEEMEKKQLFEQFKRQILSTNSPYLHKALRVANRLFLANKELHDVSDINWTLTVIDDDLINAVALPSGELIVFTGLIKFAFNDDELAIVMAHEMSHVLNDKLKIDRFYAILQHAAEEVSRTRILDIISIGLAFFIWAILPSDLTAFITQMIAEKFLKFTFQMPYSRSIENEADKVGLLLASKACFDVRYAPLFWKRMGEHTIDIPEILSTHPTHENRASDLEDLLPWAMKIREECKCDKLPENIHYAPQVKVTIRK